MRLTQRYQGLASLAALVAGTKQLGVVWWTLPHHPPVSLPSTTAPEVMTPDQALAGAALDSQRRTWSPTVVELGYWISDDAAIAAWGPLIDEVDLNDPQPVDRIRHLPPSIAVGDIVTAPFDPGGVIDAEVEERDGGPLGTRLIGEPRHSLPAEVDWGWGVGLPPPGPFKLPSENPDPYEQVLDRRVAHDLHAFGQTCGWSAQDLGAQWRTRGDLCASLASLNWPWTAHGKKLEWVRADEEIIDGSDE